MQKKTIKTLNTQLSDALQRAAELRTEIDNYKSFAENVYDGILICDADGRTVYANKKACMLCGHDESELLKIRIQSLIPSDKLAKVEAALPDGGVNRDAPNKLLTSIQHKEGQLVPVMLVITGTIWSGQPAVLLIFTDITDRCMAEERLRERDSQLHHAQKLGAVGTLAGGVAHEFNNVLSIVLGNLELAAMDIHTEHPARPYIDDAKSGILRAKKVVRQLLDLSSKSDGQSRKVDLHAIAANALSLLRASIPSHIEFHQLINECPPVMADPSHIHQLIVNLCINSAEAMDQDGGVLTVILDHVRITPGKIPSGATLAPGTYAKLTVADTGTGIDEDLFERIYEPFLFTTEGPDRGAGSGLAVVHGIVKSYAGDIVASRIPDRGVKFEVFLPTISPTKPGELLRPPDLSTLTGSERILFVDDEPKIVMIIQRQLEHFGYQVDIFTSALSALERFKASPHDYDLVISNVAMPKMTGEKFINQIRLIRPEIPAILCTGYSDKVGKKTATSLGCDYVIKPVERNQLAHLIRKALDPTAANKNLEP